jgi:FtsP/CotA-like multicopper oxidase with cupredoxin domain
MKRNRIVTAILLIIGISLAAAAARAAVFVQCPGDIDGDAVWNSPGEVQPAGVKCLHLTAGDGFVKMGDGRHQYMFGFANATGVPQDMVMMHGMVAANFPAPTIELDEGDELYLTLTNVGMMIRPDLFDPHTVHYHGFPNAASVFDGVPESSISINMGSSLTYYYQNVRPGTFMYHCHVEATEHMQMGMLGNLYVRPAQDGSTVGGCASQTYAYNDGDGSTCYDVDFPIQLGSFDPTFHDASETVQPLPFALMEDKYAMINGRGYPDTIDPNPLVPPPEGNGAVSQIVSSLIEANQGQKILLRISNLNVTRFYTLTSLGIPMLVVGKDASLLRGPGGTDLSYQTSSITLGGGEAYDVILDTAGIAPGTYFLYTTNMGYLNNNEEALGGMMTEIRINP